MKINLTFLFSSLLLMTSPVFGQEALKHPAPFYAVQKETAGFKNDIKVLHEGLSSFQARLDLIRSAEKNIEVEYFVFMIDPVSRLFVQELAAAAKRGVKVRILLDKSIAVFKVDEYYAKAFKEKGIELRYYNSAALYRVSTIQFRNHRKLLSVDDKVAITGGRNMAEDYYDLSERFNMLDRDVLIDGDIVKTLRKSFDEYFEHKITEIPKVLERPSDTRRVMNPSSKVFRYRRVDNGNNVDKYVKKMAKARDYLIQNAADRKLLKEIEKGTRKELNSLESFSCPELTYATDLPGGNFLKRMKSSYSREYRVLRQVLNQKISTIDKKLIVESPYVLHNTRSGNLFEKLYKKNVDIVLYTNSLASTDAIYVAANFYPKIKSHLRNGVDIYLHSGIYAGETPIDHPRTNSGIWGMHSKSMVYNYSDSSEVMVGTYNVDNRSNFYNSEMAIFCKGNDDLTDNITVNMKKRMDGAYRVTGKKTAVDPNGKEVNIYGANQDSLTKMKLLSPIYYLIKFLL